MAWAQKTTSGKWRGLYRDDERVIKTVAGGPFTHKAEALRKAAEAEEAVHRRKKLGHRNPDDTPTWREWAEVWWSRRHVEESTKITDRGRVENYLLPKWGPWKIHQITRGEVHAWISGLRTPDEHNKRVSDSLIQRLVHLLSASLQAAVEDEIISANPARSLRLKTPDTSRETFLTPDQFWTIYDAIAEPYQDPIHLLVTTGMRTGEGIGLHVPLIHRTSGLIEVRYVWDEKTRTVKAYPKGKSRRFVPLPEWVNERTLSTGRGETCGQPHMQGKCPGGFFLHSPEGSVLDPSRLRNAFTKACNEVGLPDVRIHDLRHTYASWLIQAGVSLAEVGRLLGHKSPQTTARYAHLSEVPKEQVLAALPTRPRESATPGTPAANGDESTTPVLRLVK